MSAADIIRHKQHKLDFNSSVANETNYNKFFLPSSAFSSNEKSSSSAKSQEYNTIQYTLCIATLVMGHVCIINDILYTYRTKVITG